MVCPWLLALTVHCSWHSDSFELMRVVTFNCKIEPANCYIDPQIVTLYLISLIVDSCHDNIYIVMTIYYLLFTVPHTMHLTLRLTLCYKTSASLLGALTACRVHQLAALLALSPSTRLATQCCFHRHQLRS